MCCRLPGARNIDEFWKNLRDGVESISFFSDRELESSGVHPAVLADPRFVKAGGVLEDIELFDARFFGYSPKEAATMDPQHRIFLECASDAVENAGYDPAAFEGLIGVYAGTDMSSYLVNNLHSLRAVSKSLKGFELYLANAVDNLATRVSYKLNLRGPSVAVQTNCSTSLVATHMACLSLLNYECDMALAGGVRINVPQKVGQLYEAGGYASPDGHCRPFDAEARGTVPSNGVAIVVLKRMHDALAEGDNIRAVIKGTAVNNDGSNKVGYTAPSVDGQAEVIETALMMAGVEAESITSIETHGTATPIGDPIEITALTRVFRASTRKKGCCAIGSVKSNIGHVSSASGVTGLIKTALSLEHKTLVPSLHFEKANPELDLDNSPFFVNTALSEWKHGRTPRRAGVSSFGIGGTNAHAILEEAPAPKSSGESRPSQLLLLSAKTSSALDRVSSNLAEHLEQHRDLNLADVAYTLHVGRTPFTHRRMLVSEELDDAALTLKTLDPERVYNACCEGGHRPVAFMFPGGGAQYVNMGIGLYRQEPAFREAVDTCADLLEPHLGADLRARIFAGDEKASEASRRLRKASICLPALFATEYALAQLWMSWGVRPQAMIGHSLGEFVAACLSGVLTLEDALALVALRGRLFDSLPKGAMLSVPLAEEEVGSLLGADLSIAAINAPSSCVVSGRPAAIERLEERLAKMGVDSRRLEIVSAGHSEMAEAIRNEITEAAATMTLNAPGIPYVSNVSGSWMTAEEATDPAYWGRHVRTTVRFLDGLSVVLGDPGRILLEVGPGCTLATLAKQNPALTPRHVVVSSMRHPLSRDSDAHALVTAVGRLWLAGVEAEWPAFHANERRRRVALPTYPFERQRYWIDPGPRRDNAGADRAPLDHRPEIADWFYIPSWRRTMPPVLPDPGAAPVRGETWLIFADQLGIGLEIADRLEGLGQRVIKVTMGEQFAGSGEGIYTINPCRCEEYDALIGQLQSLGRLPTRIVHLWSVADEEGAQSSGFFDTCQRTGFYSLLNLGKVLGKLGTAGPLRIDVVSNNLFSVAGGEAPRPEKATLLGPCSVIPREIDNVTCRIIDVELPEARTRPKEKLTSRLVAELLTRPTDSTVAHRGRDRWVQSCEPAHLEAGPPGKSRLRRDGVYLITAGLSGIGFELARFMAATVRAKLILTGRSNLPPRDTWASWTPVDDNELSSSADRNDRKRIRERIAKVRELEALGSEVLVFGADASDLEQMKLVIDQAMNRFGRIDGAIHSAAIRGGGIIELVTPEMVEREFAPKVRGAQVLDALCGNLGLDFVILCSSMISYTPHAALVAYSGANSFLDALAQQNADKNGTAWISINWPRWKGVGMSVALEEEYRARTGNDLEGGNHIRRRRGGVSEDFDGLYRTASHRIAGGSPVPRRFE